MTDANLEDEELWKKLDELEIQEELDAYLKSKKETKSESSDSANEDEISDAGSEDWSESPNLTDDEEQQKIEDQNKLTKINDYKPLHTKGDKELKSTMQQNCLLQEKVQPVKKPAPGNKFNVSIVENDYSKMSSGDKAIDQVAVQKRTRRVSFGSISEYEYQRDGKLAAGNHEGPGRHSWSEHSTVGSYGNVQGAIPEYDTSATQPKSISMEALAQSLAQINAGKVLSFAPVTTKASPCSSEGIKHTTNQPEAKMSTSSVESDSSELESPQKTPTLFFTHFEEDEDEDEASVKQSRTEEPRMFSTYSDITTIESCDHDFVYDSVPKNPADILRLYGFRRSSIDRPRLKGILKPSGSSHSLAEDSSLGDDTSISDTSLAKSPASQPSSNSGRFKISPTKMNEHVVNSLLSSSPINATASLRSSPGGSRFSVSPTKISDPSIFSPPDKSFVKPHHFSVDSATSPSRFSIKRVDENTFVAPTQIETACEFSKEKENVPVNAIVQEKSTPNQTCAKTETEQASKIVEKLSEDSDPCKNVQHVAQENHSGKKESRFKVSRGPKRPKEDKT